MRRIGRNINFNDTARVQTYVLTTTPQVIALPSDTRMHFSVCMSEGATDENVAIRLYPAADDTLFQGEILTRRTASNDALFRPGWSMTPDNIYRGEISARCDSGTVNIYVTEY